MKWVVLWTRTDSCKSWDKWKLQNYLQTFRCRARVAFSLTDFLWKLLQAETSFHFYKKLRRPPYSNILQFFRNNFCVMRAFCSTWKFLLCPSRTWNEMLQSHTQPSRAKRIQQQQISRKQTFNDCDVPSWSDIQQISISDFSFFRVKNKTASGELGE